MTKWWLILVLLIVIPSIWANPSQPLESVLRKTCGQDLVVRVDRICQNRGGHMTITKARRIRRGIVNECCMKKCSDQHIYPYCLNNVPESGSESDTLAETPDILTMDLELAETRSMVPMKNVIPMKVDVATSEPFTIRPDYGNHNIYVKDTVDSEFVNRLIKSLPLKSDFQVGTVPPEYQPYGYIPSRARIARHY